MDFSSWLMTEKKYSKRSSLDVKSRLKRALKLSGESVISISTLDLVEANSYFVSLSSGVKSQLRRAINLYNEYKERIK